MHVRTKRIYESHATSDGRRILVDRLWPRGLSKEKAHVDYWAREIAPSTELRRWYGHDPEKWSAFRRRYFAELDSNPEGLAELYDHLDAGRATLLFSSKEERLNNATALLEYLETRPKPKSHSAAKPRPKGSIASDPAATTHKRRAQPSKPRKHA